MGVVIVIVVFGGIVAVSTFLTNARTSARKNANAVVRQSLDVRSALTADELSSLMASSLAQAGASPVGSFDNSAFFRVHKNIELKLTVAAEADGSRANLTLPVVRSVSGRQEKLAPVGRVLNHVARTIRDRDATASVS